VTGDLAVAPQGEASAVEDVERRVPLTLEHPRMVPRGISMARHRAAHPSHVVAMEGQVAPRCCTPAPHRPPSIRPSPPRVKGACGVAPRWPAATLDPGLRQPLVLRYRSGAFECAACLLCKASGT
jgi:hypothetical protein